MHAESLNSVQLLAAKERISRELTVAGIHSFTFEIGPDSIPNPQAVYGVSSMHMSDRENMDASLLMSSTYVKPLVPTDLSLLLQRVFCQDGSSWLRYSAAKKYVRWQRRYGLGAGLVTREPQFRDLTVRRPQMGSTSTYALALLSDHTQREERLARVRLANWATDLQRSLVNERLQYEDKVRDERVAWLRQRLEEESQQRALVKVEGGSLNGFPAPWPGEVLSQHRSRKGSSRTVPYHQDPLGLLQIAVDLRLTAWKAVGFMGSVGFLTGLAIWVSGRVWRGSFPEWIGVE
jgi:hypothetical protein